MGDGNGGGDDVIFYFYLLFLITIGYYFIDEVKKYYWTLNDIKSALDFHFPYNSTERRELWCVDLREAGWWGEVRAGLTLQEINDMKKDEKIRLVLHSVSLLYISNATQFF